MIFWPLSSNIAFRIYQTLHQLHDLYNELDLHRITSGFYRAFVTGVAYQQGTLTLPDTWFRPPIWDLLMLQLLRPEFTNLSCLYSTFHFEYPSVLSHFGLIRMSWDCRLFIWLIFPKYLVIISYKTGGKVAITSICYYRHLTRMCLAYFSNRKLYPNIRCRCRFDTMITINVRISSPREGPGG